MSLTPSPSSGPDIGELAPWFITRCGSIADFHFSSLGGRHIILCFPGSDAGAASAALAMMVAWAQGIDERHCVCFGLMQAGAAVAAREQFPSLRIFDDFPGGTITRAYGIEPDGGEPDGGGWVVIDPMMRLLMRAPLADGAGLLARARLLQPAGLMATADITAPVMTLPRVFEPEFCRHLIALYQADGGQDSGYMRDRDGKTVGIIDHDFKRRRDMIITDPEIVAAARTRIEKRLVPVIARALGFRATRIERNIVACYDSADNGFFRAHRDNTTRATAHRRFAVTINLNAEEFEGGELCFPEFGPRTYRAATGGAVVFSCALLHEALPVTRGVRYAFLPFLYDEEGARTRVESQKFLAGEKTEKEQGDRPVFWGQKPER